MIKIHPYRPSDEAEVLRLLGDLQDHVAKLDPWHRLRRRYEFNTKVYLKHLRQELRRNGRIFLAEHNQQIVGLVAAAVTASAKSTVEIKPGLGGAGRVFELIVDEQARGLGVGKQLLKAADQYLRSKKCGIIYIGCFATNTKTLDFYRRNGYVERTIEFAKKVKR